MQVGDLEDRNDDAAIEEFNAIYQRWHEGELDVPLPGGETGRAGARPLPAGGHAAADALPRRRRVDGDIVVVSHGAAIRLVAAVLAGVDGSFALDHHLANTESVVLSPITDGRWSCVQWGDADAAVLPGARRAPGRGRAAVAPTRWADAPIADRGARRHPIASQSMPNACSDLGRRAAVLGALRPDSGVVDDGAVAVL